MTVFSRVLKKVSRWELPTPHHHRRAFSSPSGQSLSASRSLKDVAAPYGLFDQETEQSDYATQLSEGRLGATRALIDQIVEDSGQLQSASHSLKDMAALHGLNKEKSGFNAEEATASHPCKGLAAPCGYMIKSGFNAEEATASHPCKGLAAPCGYSENSGFNAEEATASHPCKGLAAPCGYSDDRGFNCALAAPSSGEYTGASYDENTGALKTKCNESESISNTVTVTSRKTSLAVEIMNLIVHVVVYYLILLVYSLKLSSRHTPTFEASLKLSGTTSFFPHAHSFSLTCEVNNTMGSRITAITGNTTGRTMNFFTHLTVYYLMLLVCYLVKKMKEYCEMFVTSLLKLNSSNSASETSLTLTVRSRKVYTASSTSANKSFFTHLIVFLMILLVYALNSSGPHVKSSPSSEASLSTTSSSTIFNFTSEANRTSTMSIWSASSTAGPTMSFCTHVIVYYLMLLVYYFVKKAKECCVKFVRSLLKFSNSESAPTKVYSPCNFCDRDITYGEIMEQLEPAIYSPVTPLYIECECKGVDVEKCLDNKPCPNAWFDSRLYEKNKSLFEYFENSAIRGMLFDTQITVATAAELFGIPLPVSGSTLEVELLLYQLQDEYHFTLKCADCGDILSTPVICGGGIELEKTRTRKKPKKRRKIGKKSKGKRKGAKAETESAATDDIDIKHDSTVSADEPVNDQESILSHADSDIDISTSTAAFIDPDVTLTAESDDFDNTEITDDCFYETMLSDHSIDIDSDTSNIGTNFENTVKTKSKHAKYNASNKGKAARRRYDLGEKGKWNKAKRNKKYFTSNDGKAAKIDAQKAYLNKVDGKAAKSRANKTYFGTDDGSAAKSRANKIYSGTDAGRSARSAATEAHAPTEKRRASRKRYARTKKEYMRSYIPFYRDNEKIRIDFTSEKVAGNTNSLLNHTVPPELATSFKSFEKEIIRGRCLVSPPTQYSSVSARGNMKTASACYKLMLSRKLLSALGNLSIDDESWITIPGMSKKALKRKHFNPRNRASIILAELAWLKRQQCVTVLKIQLNRLSSYADAIVSKMDIQDKESDKMAALLGLQSHQKASEPYIANVSYVDGQPYNYEAEVQKFEDAKASDKKAPSHITYRCNENCILPNNEEDLRNLRKLFDECSKLSDLSTGEFRRFLK